MGEFRSSSGYDIPMFLHPDYLRKVRTIVNGEWYLKVTERDQEIVFLACNNEYTEWLWEVKERGFLFNMIFGNFITRLIRAKTKYQGWVDKKNSDYFHVKEVCQII